MPQNDCHNSLCLKRSCSKRAYSIPRSSSCQLFIPIQIETCVTGNTGFLSVFQRIAALKGKPTNGTGLQRKTNKVCEEGCRVGPPSGQPVTTTSPTQDHCPSLTPGHKREPQGPALILPLGPPKAPDPDDLSACSDVESGVADLSSRSSSGGDDGKDPDSDEAVYSTV